MPAFLFTDLESSTRLWESYPDEMQKALARHDAVLRSAVTGSEGEVVKITGDGMLAVFATSVAALEAATSAQLKLAGEGWATPEPLRVRMGVHAGEGESRDGDYFGPAVNRAARIMAAAHGGQVLVSGLVADLASGSLAAGGTLKDLGVHRLKDLTLPERIYQLVHPDLPDDFPPPATLEARPNNLPLQGSEFFGRENELATVRLLLGASATRLVTLTGPGGTGKTRLGLQVAAEHLDEFRDGVYFVDLAPEIDPDAAYEAIVRTLGLTVVGAGHPLEVLEAKLRDRQMMLLLDNFEQVMDAAKGVAEILQRCPHLKILVTSREALRVRAETVFPVPALSLPHPDSPIETIAESESVRLFVERARNVRPGFAVSAENAAILAEICLRLDGLPLAIELAAARLNVFTPQELMGRLRGRLDVLGAGGRDLPARQRTLWGAIGWSYELLDEEERQVFEMMGIFSPCPMPPLETVAEAALGLHSVVDVLASLVDKSLIRSLAEDGLQRFSMLQTMKEYALERLAASPDREARTREAHARCFTDHAIEAGHELRGPNRDRAVDELVAVIGNLRTAWRYWVERGDLEQIFGLIDTLWAMHDAKGWYHAAIELANDTLGLLATSDSPGHSADELALRTSVARALMAIQGYTVEVEESFKRVLDLSQEPGTAPAQRFPVLRTLATYYMNIADFDSTLRIGTEILELAEESNEEAFLVDGHYIFGMGKAFGGDIPGGLVHLEKALELYDPDQQPPGRFRLGPSLGVVIRVATGLLLWQCGALERARTRLDDCLDLARRLDHPISLAYALYHHGLFQVYRQRFDGAELRSRELAAVAAEHDYPLWATLAAVLEGISLTGRGLAAEGLELTERGVELYMGLTTPPVFWPMLLALRALVFAAGGEPEKGLSLIDEAIELVGGQESSSPEFRVIRGDILGLLGDRLEAEQAYESAIRGAAATGTRLIELQALCRLVRLHGERNGAPDRRDDLRALFSGFSEGFDEHDLVVAASLLE